MLMTLKIIERNNHKPPLLAILGEGGEDKHTFIRKKTLAEPGFGQL